MLMPPAELKLINATFASWLFFIIHFICLVALALVCLRYISVKAIHYLWSVPMFQILKN